MHRGYSLSLTYDNTAHYEVAKSRFAELKQEVQRNIQSFTNKDGTIDGSKMSADWFPVFDADVFISHSHKDEETAFALAGWLSEHFGLTAFVDSGIWGFSAELLKIIDNAYCLNPGGETYSYEKRNHSTSHVHMMLSTALSRMIDRSECLFFLNTPNSITPEDVIEDRTLSPWIYSEIEMTRLIRKKSAVEHRQRIVSFTESMIQVMKAIRIKYRVTLDHLAPLDEAALVKWGKAYNGSQFPLDILYAQT